MAYNTDSNAALKNDSSNQDDIIQIAKNLHPISDLNKVNRKALCRSVNVTHLQRNDQMKVDAVMRGLVYVVEGSVTLYNGKNEVFTLGAGTREANQPLKIDQASNHVLKTKTFAKLIRFGREQMEILLKEQEKAATRVIERQVSKADNLIFDDIYRDMENNAVSLCNFKETAQKIMTAVKSKKMEIPALADIIQSDPGLTAHVVLAASRMDGASIDPVQTIRGAITRLGVETTVKMAMALPAKNALQSENTVIVEHFEKYCRRSTLTAAISQVLAHKVPYLKPDMALLAGVTADLGELLVIGYADKHPEEFNTSKQLTDSVNNLREIVGSWLLGTWGFSPEFVEATHTARDWYRNKTGDIEYSDLVTAALLIIQSEFPDHDTTSIPNASSLLITRRLQQVGIDLTNTTEILQSAGQKISDLQGLLTG